MAGIVLDTNVLVNVLVSALISSGTPPALLYEAWARGDFAVVTSAARIDELRRVQAITAAAGADLIVTGDKSRLLDRGSVQGELDVLILLGRVVGEADLPSVQVDALDRHIAIVDPVDRHRLAFAHVCGLSRAEPGVVLAVVVGIYVLTATADAFGLEAVGDLNLDQTTSDIDGAFNHRIVDEQARRRDGR